MIEFLDSKNKIENTIRQCIESAKKEVIIIIEFLQIDNDYKTFIANTNKRNVPIYVIYKGGYSQTKVDKEKEYFQELCQKYIGLYTSEKGFDFNIYLNEDMAIFTSMGLKPYYDNIYFGIKIDKNNDNKIYEDIRLSVITMIKNNVKGLVNIAIGTDCSTNTNENMDILSSSTSLEVTKSVYHNTNIFITDRSYVKNNPHVGDLWKNIADDKNITYRKNIVIEAFKMVISEKFSDNEIENMIKELDDKIPTYFLMLDKGGGKIDDNIVVATPNHFKFDNTYFHFNRGKIIDIIPKERLPDWIKKFEGKNFREYVNFHCEQPEKKSKNGLKIRTKHGLLVRSDTERNIAEFLTDNGIIIQYEPPLVLDGIELHPDFYIQDIGVYLEHWGDDRPNYMTYRKKKEDIYKKHNVKYISTEKSDINNIRDKLKVELNKFINKTNWK